MTFQSLLGPCVLEVKIDGSVLIMAAFGKSIFGQINQNLLQFYNGSALFTVARRHVCKKKYKDPRTPNKYRRLYKHLSMGPTVDSIAQSLSFKGYLRPHKQYEPPAGVAGTVREIKLASGVKSGENGVPFSLEDKGTFLSLCSTKLKHEVYSSVLHEINTVSDVIEYFEKPVDITLPLDALKMVELPENLHIQHEYLRFHPDTDTKFGGQTAFPLSSTIVTGLKYKKKYAGFEAKKKWPR